MTGRQGVDDAEQLLARIEQQPDLGRRALGEDLTELPELVESDVRVRREVLLGLRAQRHEPGVVVGEEGEVGRRLARHRLGPPGASETTQDRRPTATRRPDAPPTRNGPLR